MITNPIITDLVRTAHREAQSARPNSPVVPESVRRSRVMPVVRLQVTAALRWLADHTPASAERLRLLDGTPVVCGRSRATATRSSLFGYAGYGHDTSHHCFYWGSRLLLICAPEGTVTGFGLANPKAGGGTPSRGGHAARGPGQPTGTRHAAGGRQGLCRP